MILAELWVKFLGDATDLQKKTAQAQKDIETFGRNMESVGQRLAIAVSLPLVAGAIAAAKVTGEMEQNAVAFTTLLKSADAAKVHLEALQAFALKTPFQFPELVKSSRLMQAMGFSVGKVIPMMTTLGNAVSAMGGGNEMLQRIILSFGQMQARGKLTGEEIRELAHTNVPALALVAAKLGITTAQAMKQMEAGGISAKVAMAAILEYMETRFKGGMEAQSLTMLGMWSNVRDKITFTLADVGKAMLPMAKDVITNYINPLLDKVRELAGEFSKLPPVIQGVAVATVALVAAAGPAIWLFGSLATNAAVLAKLIGPMFAGMVGGASSAAATATSTAAATIAKALGPLGMAAAKLGVFAAVAVSAALAAKELYRFGQQVVELAGYLAKATVELIPFKEELADTWKYLVWLAKPWTIKIKTVVEGAGKLGLLGPGFGGLSSINDFIDMMRSGEGAAGATGAVLGKLKSAGFLNLKSEMDLLSKQTADKVDEMRNSATSLDKSWKAVSLKDLRKELTEMQAGYHALRAAGVMSLGDIADAQKKLSDLSREITDRQFGAGIMDLAARAWFKASEGVKAVTDAVFQFMMGGTPFVKQLELERSALGTGAAAAYQYANALKVAYDQMHTFPISGRPNIQMLEPDWMGRTVLGTIPARGTTLEAAMGVDSAVALRRAATLAGNEWERMVALQKTGARTAVDVKLAYEKWVEAEERAIGLTDKHKQSMSGFRQVCLTAAREISTAFDEMARSISEIIWPRGGTTEPAWLATQQKAVSALSSAYEGLAGRGYNDPKKALEEIIARIKGAGTAAEANAIAIKNFGASGVEMAAMIRNGTLSTEQFAEALKVATGEMAKLSAETQSKAKGIASVFEEVARAVLRSILTIIIEQGLLKLMKVLGLVKSDVKSLEEGFGQLIGKIASAVASWVGFGKKVAESPIPSLPGAISGASTTVSGGAGAAGGIGGAAGGAGGAAGGAAGAAGGAGTGIMGAINMVTGAVTAISSVIGNFQMFGMNKTLDLIEHEARYAQIHLLNLLEKANLTWPKLIDMMDYNWNVQMPYLQKICAAVEAGGAGGGGNTYITVNAQSSDPRAIVEAIKVYVSTRSPVFA